MAYYVTDSEGRIIASGGCPDLLLKYEAPRLGFGEDDIKYTEEEILNLDEGFFLASQAPAPPEPTEEELAERRRAEIEAELDEIDRRGRRASRAVALALARGLATGMELDPADVDKLAELEARAEPLRAELAALAGSDDEVTE